METTNAVASKAARAGGTIAQAALAVGVLAGIAELAAGPLYRIEWLPLGAGLQTVRWAATAALAGAALALVALLLRAYGGLARRLGVAAAALVLNAVVAGPPLYMYSQLMRLPRIHDISTDTTNPPSYVAVLGRRQGARNPVDYKPETAAEQMKGYPDLVPLRLDAAPAQAFERASRAARSMGWEIVAEAPQDGRIEATDTTLLFGFKDDVVVRITPQGPGSVVDVRSLSRVGGSDFGANARRVRAFLARLAAG